MPASVFSNYAQKEQWKLNFHLVADECRNRMWVDVIVLDGYRTTCVVSPKSFIQPSETCRYLECHGIRVLKRCDAEMTQTIEVWPIARLDSRGNPLPRRSSGQAKEGLSQPVVQ